MRRPFAVTLCQPQASLERCQPKQHWGEAPAFHILPGIVEHSMRGIKVGLSHVDQGQRDGTVHDDAVDLTLPTEFDGLLQVSNSGIQLVPLPTEFSKAKVSQTSQG